MRASAEIITIGDEILYGQTLDTNSHWISGELDKIGIRVLRKTTIPDRESDILKAFKRADKEADIILITGGLGPTNDDLTKPCLAKYFGVELEMNEEALLEVQDIFQRAGREMNDLNKNQALMPVGAEKISNHLGTAPGIWINSESSVFISMPGVPYEMKGMMQDTLLPMLEARFVSGIIHHEILRTVGIPESRLAEMIADWEEQLPADIKLAYLPSSGLVKLRLTGIGESRQDIQDRINQEIDKVLPIIDKYVFANRDITLQEALGILLKKAGKSISVAESCTGGYLSHLITSVPGSSAYFQGSFVPYSNEIKAGVLGVKEETLKSHGAVSEDVVKELADNVRKVYNTSVGVSVSGIAGPTGGTPDKPVGTVWIGYSDETEVVARKFVFTKNRKINIELTAYAALNMIRVRLPEKRVTS